MGVVVIADRWGDSEGVVVGGGKKVQLGSHSGVHIYVHATCASIASFALFSHAQQAIISWRVSTAGCVVGVKQLSGGTIELNGDMMTS